MTIVNPDAELLVITTHGMGKRSKLGHGIADLDQHISGGGYRLTKRGSKGVTSIRLKEGDSVVQAIMLEQDEDLIMTSLKGLIVRINTEDIRTLGRSSQGVRIMRLRDDDVVSVITKVAKLDEDEMKDVADEKDEANDASVAMPFESADDEVLDGEELDEEVIDDEEVEDEDIDDEVIEDEDEDIEEEEDEDEDR
jgi:DNA gyrase subunit A